MAENQEFTMEKVYNPQQIEDKLYKMWEESGAFTAHRAEGKKPFTIVMPPPNITGQLHMGHAMDCLLQDAPIRYHRMKGDPTLWLPGTDHASIATEVKVVDAMAKEGLTKEMVGREGFLERAWAWKKEYGGRIVRQLRKLGVSCDWSRERFTMDEGCNEAVREVFVRLYEKGLIYRGNRIINWCPECQTALSDAEVEYEEQASHLWHIRYPGADGGEGVIVATTRPETMLGDTAVCVNPKDERYTDLVGKTVLLPIMNKQIPIVADDYVEMDFGTGCVKMTPAHDPNDFEVGTRHNLEVIRVTNDDGTMNRNAGKFEGMTAMECREAVVKELQELGLMVKIEDYTHNVGTCYRCHHTVDPVTSTQWFVKMEPLAKPAIEAVRSGKVQFVPERFSKTYFNWMENIRDWCISRQLWWGHQIPAWYCDDCGETVVAKSAPCTCPKCGGTKLTQDPDTLDTWFSSALWPFSTLGWPNEESEDLKYFYPTNTLVTGYDIIGFWVSRMIFSGLAYTGKAPFDTVCIHGIVRDSQGRKMSKSLGNGIDPLEVIAQYGADALRFMLVDGSTPGNDMRYSEKKVEAARNFANKLWNAARFVLMYLGNDYSYPGLPKDLAIEDKWILSKVNTLAKEVTDNLERFELGIAVAKLYDFIWDVFCDWYIEIAKIRLQSGEGADTAKAVLVYVLTDILKLLHPFMPFITEEIYQAIPHDTESIMISKWPEYDPTLSFADEEAQMEKIMDAIRAIRNRRAEMNIPPSKKSKVYVETAFSDVFAVGSEFIKRLAYASDVEIADAFGDLGNTVTIVTNDAKIYIPLGDLVDFEAEAKRLQKELAAAEEKLAFINKKLDNPGFVNKAPEKVVQQNRDEAAKLTEKIANLRSSLENLGK